MKKILLPLLSFVALTGCGDRSQIEDVVRARLKDPSSAQFGTLIQSESGYHACIEVNAKNSMGGFVGTKIVQLMKNDGEWEVVSFDQYASNCEKFM